MAEDRRKPRRAAVEENLARRARPKQHTRRASGCGGRDGRNERIRDQITERAFVEKVKLVNTCSPKQIAQWTRGVDIQVFLWSNEYQSPAYFQEFDGLLEEQEVQIEPARGRCVSTSIVLTLGDTKSRDWNIRRIADRIVEAKVCCVKEILGQNADALQAVEPCSRDICSIPDAERGSSLAA